MLLGSSFATNMLRHHNQQMQFNMIFILGAVRLINENTATGPWMGDLLIYHNGECCIVTKIVLH